MIFTYFLLIKGEMYNVLEEGADIEKLLNDIRLDSTLDTKLRKRLFFPSEP